MTIFNPVGTGDLPALDSSLPYRDYSRLETTLFTRERMASLHVLVVGAGALGNEVIKNLALLGVGYLYIVDCDIIERSNLTRAILFCTPDIEAHLQAGTPKASFAAQRAHQINPDTKASPLISEVADLGLGILRRMDLIFGCLDNELGRLELGWACNRINKPLVDAGLGLTNYSTGMVSIYPGTKGPCYACHKGRQRRSELLQELHGREDPCWMSERRRERQGIVSTTPLMASVVAGLQVEMGLRHYFPASPSTQERGIRIVVSMNPKPAIESFDFERSAACPLHEYTSGITSIVDIPHARSKELTVTQLLALNDEVDGGGNALCLDWPIVAVAECLDCRHRWEPMHRRARFKNKTGCPGCLSRHVREKEVLTLIDKSSHWAARTLTDLGLPLLHVHEIVQGGGDAFRRIHIELSDDRSDPDLAGMAWV